MLFPARATLNVSICYSRRLRFNSLFESGFRWRLFLDLNQCHFSITLPVFLYRVGFHNQRNKEPFQSTLLSIIRNGFTCRCVSVLQMCFEIFPHCELTFCNCQFFTGLIFQWEFRLLSLCRVGLLIYTTA